MGRGEINCDPVTKLLQASQILVKTFIKKEEVMTSTRLETARFAVIIMTWCRLLSTWQGHAPSKLGCVIYFQIQQLVPRYRVRINSFLFLSPNFKHWQVSKLFYVTPSKLRVSTVGWAARPRWPEHVLQLPHSRPEQVIRLCLLSTFDLSKSITTYQSKIVTNEVLQKSYQNALQQQWKSTRLQ